MDLSTFELKLAFQKGDCPICRLKQKSEARYIFSLLWENVNDGVTRAHIVNALGFCREHAWQLVDTEQREFGGGLGTGILYEDLAQRALCGLDELRSNERAPAPVKSVKRARAALSEWLGRKRSGRWNVAFPQGLAASEDCRVCQVAQGTEEAYLQWLTEHCAEPEFREGYHASDGLCLPHLRAAIELAADADTRAFLIDTAEEKLGILAKQLNEYLRKHIWDYRDEPKLPAEQSAWIRTVEFFVSKK